MRWMSISDSLTTILTGSGFATAGSVNCPDATVKKPDPIHEGWDMEYLGEGIVNGVLNVPVVAYLPCEENWGDHKIVTIEEDSTVALAHLSNAWRKYINSPWTLPNYHPELKISQKMYPQAKIMFFAACALNPSFAQPGEIPPFIQMWDIHDPTIDSITETRQRVIIVPDYAVTNLADVANQWVHILQHLVKGETVSSAVGHANDETNKKWKALGNPNVTLKTAK
jgi:hypothetical protein